MSASEPMENDRDGKKPTFARQVAKLSQSVLRGGCAAAALVVFGVALSPGEPGEPSLLGWDKVSHIAAFLALTLSARAAWPLQARWKTGLALLAFGAAIELGQSLTNWGRTASLADLIADLIGIGLGFVIARALHPVLAQFIKPRTS